jgi:hypothetical protein
MYIYKSSVQWQQHWSHFTMKSRLRHKYVCAVTALCVTACPSVTSGQTQDEVILEAHMQHDLTIPKCGRGERAGVVDEGKYGFFIRQLFTNIESTSSYNRINLVHDLLSHSIINSSHRVCVSCRTCCCCSKHPTDPILLLVLKC